MEIEKEAPHAEVFQFTILEIEGDAPNVKDSIFLYWSINQGFIFLEIESVNTNNSLEIWFATDCSSISYQKTLSPSL